MSNLLAYLAYVVALVFALIVAVVVLGLASLPLLIPVGLALVTNWLVGHWVAWSSFYLWWAAWLILLVVLTPIKPLLVSVNRGMDGVNDRLRR